MTCLLASSACNSDRTGVVRHRTDSPSGRRWRRRTDAMSELDDEDLQSAIGDDLTSAKPDEDSEIDFDDETDDDQLPLDEVEAAELGVQLDDPDTDAADFL
jgi:hypothetical protein